MRFEMLACAVVGAACLLCSTPAAAQQSISGGIRSIEGELMAGARVKATGPSEREAEADHAGRFALAGLESGDYSLLITAEGRLDERVEVSLGPRQTIELDVQLAPATAERSSITVSADYDIGRAQTSQLLTTGDLGRLPPLAMTDIPKLVLRTTPGAVLGHDNLVHLKGNELSLHQFVDGVGFLDNPQAQFSPGYSPQYIQSVNIITGGIPAEFGNRLGGVLDIETKSGMTFQGGGLVLGAGTIVSRHAGVEYGLGGAKWDAYVYSSGFSDGRYLNPPERREIHDLGYGSHNMLKLGYSPTGKDRLSLMATAAGANFQLPNTLHDAEEGRDSSKRARESSAILRWQRSPSASSTFSVSLFQRYSTSRLLPTTDAETPFGRGFRRSLTHGVKADGLWQLGRHIVKSGFDLARLSLNEDFFFDPREAEGEEAALRFSPKFRSPFPTPFALTAGPPLVLSGATVEALDFAGRARGGQGGFYVQDRFSLFDNFTIHAGLRYDRYSVLETEDQWSPRIGLSYHVQPTGTVLRAVYNRFFVPPPLEYLQLGNAFGTGEIEEFEIAHADLSFETPFSGADEGAEGASPLGPIRSLRQHYFETGVQQPIHKNILLDVSAYHHQGNNAYENVEISNTRLFVPTTFSRERTWGSDASLRLRPLPGLGLFGSLNYGYIVTNFFGPASGGIAAEAASPGQQITPAFDQRHTGSATLGYRHSKTGFNLGFSVGYGSGTPTERALDPGHEETAAPAAALSFPALFLGGGQEEEGEEILVRLPSYWTFDVWTGVRLWQSESRSVELQFNAENLGNRIFEIAKESEETPVQFGSRRRSYGQLRFRF